jgi:hypothetical protein
MYLDMYYEGVILFLDNDYISSSEASNISNDVDSNKEIHFFFVSGTANWFYCVCIINVSIRV